MSKKRKHIYSKTEMGEVMGIAVLGILQTQQVSVHRDNKLNKKGTLSLQFKIGLWKAGRKSHKDHWIKKGTNQALATVLHRLP